MCVAIRGSEEMGFRGEGVAEMMACFILPSGKKTLPATPRPRGCRIGIHGRCLLSSASLQRQMSLPMLVPLVLEYT